MAKRSSDAAYAFRMPCELAGMPKDSSVLLALSGGADSRALLHMLAKAAAEQSFSLTLAHVNHSIRGAESERDRDFCQRLADAYDLEIVFLDADVPRLAKEHGRGLEEEARAVRYAFFAQLMRERNIQLLATAHHADDLLETLLFRIARGTGMKGLGSISPCRRFENGFLVRPLLEMTRGEILDYCEQNQLEYVTDSTNSDTAYARNRIRRDVVPVLESLFDEPQKRAVALAEELREDDAFLEALAREHLCQCQTPRGLSVACLCDMPSPIRRRVLKMWAEEVCGRGVGCVQLEAVQRLALGVTPRARVALSSAVSVVCEMGYLRTLTVHEVATELWEAPFCEGEHYDPMLDVVLTVERAEKSQPTKIHKLSTELYININAVSAIMKKGFYWRTYREGDVIFCHGMHKKLRRVYREAGISPRLRTRIPLLCDAEGVIWAPFANAVRDSVEDKSGEPYVIRVVLDGRTDEVNAESAL